MNEFTQMYVHCLKCDNYIKCGLYVKHYLVLFCGHNINMAAQQDQQPPPKDRDKRPMSQQELDEDASRKERAQKAFERMQILALGMDVAGAA